MTAPQPGLRVAIVDGGSFVLPYDHELIGALRRRGFSVDFYASETRYNAELLNALRGMPGVTVHAFAVSGSVSGREAGGRLAGVHAYVRLLTALWRQRAAFASINFQFSVLWPLEWLLFAALRQPVVFTVHNAVPHGFAGTRHRPTQWLASRAHTLVFASESTRDDFLQRYGPRFAAKAEVLLHGVLPVAAGAAPVAYTASSARPQALIFWGNVRPYKGVELFAALAREARLSEFKFEVHGAWAAELRPLRDELSTLGVSVNDAYLDAAALRRLLARDAVFVLPYRAASQSGALFSLLHQGRWFLCADVGDLGAFMRRHGLEGLLLRERSPAAVAACLAYAEQHRDALCLAFQKAQDACAWDVLMAGADAVYAPAAAPDAAARCDNPRPMMNLLKSALARAGVELTSPADRESQALADLPAADRAIIARVAPFTMTSLQRRASLIGAVDHVLRHGIAGDIVECGVWRGGSMMAVALALIARGDTTRDLYLYDTFEGMSAPTDADRSAGGESAQAQLARTPRGEGVWCEAGLADVQANLWATGYPRERIHFVQGKVEDTVPATLPERVALLRLDTDWYESTRHELQHFYPRLARHGVLVIDDYGHWQGARQAVDEYFAAAAEPVFLHRVDYTARLVVKA